MTRYRKQLHNAGAAMMLFIVFFSAASIALTYSISRSVYAELTQFRLAYDSKQSYLTAEAALEDAAYRFATGLDIDFEETVTILDATATATISFDATDDIFLIVAEAEDNDAYRSSQMELYLGPGAAFNFGVQTGNGGFRMSNGSAVIGNVFSNGTIEKTLGGTATIYGDAISAGPGGLIKDIHATGSAWAHTIEDSTIDGYVSAYTLDGGMVGGGAEYYEKIGGAVVNGSPEISGVVVGDEDTVDMPITEADIDAMQQEIIDNGTVIASTSAECSGGEYYIDTDTTLGWQKIECDLRVKKQGSATILTLDGPLWVVGDIEFDSGPTIEIDSSVGNKTVPFIADNPFSRATSSLITVGQGTSFNGLVGENKSYVLLISRNEDAENGEVEDVDAIFLGQSSGASGSDYLAYTNSGRITLSNSVTLKEITAYLVVLGNSATVVYESGLVNLLFTSGPGGGFTIGSWTEIE